MHIVLYKFFLFLKLYFFIICCPVLCKDSFDTFKNSIISEGIEKGISKEALKQNIDPIKAINKKVLKLYNNQPEFKITFRDYQKGILTKKEFLKGKELVVKHKNVLLKLKENTVFLLKSL